MHIEVSYHPTIQNGRTYIGIQSMHIKVPYHLTSFDQYYNHPVFRNLLKSISICLCPERTKLQCCRPLLVPVKRP